MSFKIVLAVLAAACIAQAFTIDQDTIEANQQTQRSSVSDIFDKITKALDKVREQVKDLDTQLKDVINKAFAQAEQAAHEAAAKWKEAIDSAVEGASNAGIDVSECLKVNPDQVLNQTVDKILAESRQCIAKENVTLEYAQSRIDEVLEEIEDLVQKARDASEKCESKPTWSQIICVATTLTPLMKDAVELGKDIASFATEIAALTTIAAENIGHCVKDSYENNGAEAQQVVEATVNCIRDKLNPQPF